jgi:hypothetical protein
MSNRVGLAAPGAHQGRHGDAGGGDDLVAADRLARQSPAHRPVERIATAADFDAPKPRGRFIAPASATVGAVIVGPGAKGVVAGD